MEKRFNSTFIKARSEKLLAIRMNGEVITVLSVNTRPSIMGRENGRETMTEMG
jgi:hypothetical protein